MYGESKRNGELEFKRSGCNHIIMCMGWVFSEYGNNFFKTMLRLGTDPVELSIVGDQVGCPTYTQGIAKTIVSMLSSLGSKRSASGVYHYCEDQPCS